MQQRRDPDRQQWSGDGHDDGHGGGHDGGNDGGNDGGERAEPSRDTPLWQRPPVPPSDEAPDTPWWAGAETQAAGVRPPAPPSPPTEEPWAAPPTPEEPWSSPPSPSAEEPWSSPAPAPPEEPWAAPPPAEEPWSPPPSASTPWSSPPPPPPPDSWSSPVPVVGGGTPPGSGGSRRTLVLVAVLAVLAGAGVGVGAWVLTRDDSTEHTGAAGAGPSVTVTATATAGEDAAGQGGSTLSDGDSVGTDAQPSSAAAQPSPGYSRAVDPVGYTVDVPQGWVREEKRGVSAEVVTYASPDDGRTLKLFQVVENTPAESLDLAENGPGGFDGLADFHVLDRSSGADWARLDYRYDDPKSGTTQVIDHRFTAADGTLYAIRSSGPSGLDVAEPFTVALNSFCPTGASCTSP
ncbi:hypothetical protein SAVCW2_46380 [Streptomyces avermitilis]|uniref:Uncharacterized protein n=2 Tax=Streptomyces avermitilis TaxID=33903 RepID=A0A499VNW6_STRAX|nr:hypothetical protein SAVMC3_39500 [Streptomyces avermitilis]GDY85439.1 hypothetical protein SAVCW2_46380 [Streptomyces avermitilis]